MYLSVGSGIYFKVDPKDSIYSMDKTHAISKFVEKENPNEYNIYNKAFNTFIFIMKSQGWSPQVGMKIYIIHKKQDQIGTISNF